MFHVHASYAFFFIFIIFFITTFLPMVDPIEMVAPIVDTITMVDILAIGNSLS